MSFRDMLIGAQQTPASAYHQFLISSKIVHAFLEGPDDRSFYVNFILHYVNEKQLEVYECGRKAEVYKTHELVMNYLEGTPRRAGRVKVLFFVDKDLSDLTNETFPQLPEIYVTDLYSIESYLISKSMFGRILSEICRFRGNELPDLQKIQDKFEQELERFHQFMRPIMAWIIFMIRDGHNPNYNNFELKKVFDPDGDLVFVERLDEKYRDQQHALEETCRVKTPLDAEESINQLNEELVQLDPKIYIRGKYEVEFLILFLRRFQTFISREMSGIGLAFHPPISSEKDVIRVLGPRIQMPHTLRQFLEMHLQSSN